MGRGKLQCMERLLEVDSRQELLAVTPPGEERVLPMLRDPSRVTKAGGDVEQVVGAFRSGEHACAVTARSAAAERAAG